MKPETESTVRSRIISFSALLLICLFVSGCALFRPDHVDVQERVVLASEYSFSGDTNAQAFARNWWDDIDDPQLQELMVKALQSNFSIVQAEARVRQAYAVEKKVRSGSYPSASIQSSAGVTEREDAGSSEKDMSSESYGLGLAASYEIDLWGALTSSRRAASLRAEASQQDLYTAQMTISAELASTYMQFLAQGEKVKLLKKQIQNERDILNLVELRFRRGQNSALDVLEQRSALKSAESALAPAQAQTAYLLDKLSVLCGMSPGLFELEAADLPSLPTKPQRGLPADLLSNRPDIASAWLQLRASEWDVSQARANRLPNIQLSTSAGYDSDAIGSLFDAWILRLVGDFTAPLLDGGNRKAEVIRQRAVVEEQLAAYRKTVFNAVMEVQDAVRREESQRLFRQAKEEQLELTRQSYDQAMNRYGRGQESFLRVLNANSGMQQLEVSVLDSRLAEWNARIQLYRALGGGWGSVDDISDDIPKEMNPDTGSDQ